MDLSKIRFTVETDQLKEAIGLLGQLKTASAGMKEAVAARKESVQVQREEIKTAKEQEKLSALQKKTSEAAAKAAEAEAKAMKAGAQAQKEVAGEVDAATRMVEKQTLAMKILRGETWELAGAQISLGEGITKSQANQLANLKLLGATSEQMRVLASSFEQYNAITGLNTFDKSAGALSKMKKELAELATIQRLSAENASLTKDEIVGLAREELRLTQQWISEKKNINELDSAIQNLRKEYDQLAITLNKNKAEAEDMERKSKETARQQIKDAKAVVAAQEYVTREMNRSHAAFLAATGDDKINTGTSNRLVKMEDMLRRTGIEAEKAKIMLAQYKEELIAVQKAGASRQADHISRAIGPQLTDIVVGLATGQSPMMVLLQQGGQLRDQFGQIGIKAEEMGDAMKRAGREMVSSIYNTGRAVGQFLVGSFVDAGKAISGGLVGGAMKGFTALQVLKAEMIYGKGSAQALEAALIGTAKGASLLESSIVRFVGIGLGALLGAAAIAAIGLAVALKQVITEENDLVRAMYLTNSGLNMSTDAAFGLAASMKEVGVTTTEAMKALTSVKDLQNISIPDLKEFIRSAVELERVGGPAIEETMKGLTDFGKDPVKALREVAIRLGTVTQASIDQVKALRDSGDAYGATSLAAQIAGKAQSEAAKMVYDDLSSLSKLLVDGKRLWDEFWEKAKGPSRKKGIQDKIDRLTNQRDRFKEGSSRYKNLDEQITWEKNKLVTLQKPAALRAEVRANAEAQQVMEERSAAAFSTYQRERFAELGREEYAKKRLQQEWAKDPLAFKKLQSDATRLTAVMQLYFKEYDDMQKKVTGATGREVKDNALQTQRNIMNDILSEKKKALSTELSVLKAYREAEFITESDYRNKSTSVYSASMQEQGSVLDNWYKKSLFALDGLRKSAKGNQSILNNLNNEQEKIEQTYKSMQGERKSDIFGFYTKSALDALKSLTDFNNKLKEIGREEDKLAASRKQEKEFSIASLYTDPDVIAGMRAFVAEQQRINDKISELEREKKELDDLMAAAKANQTNAILFGDMEDVKKSTAIYDQYAAKLLTAEEAMQKLKASLATSPEEAKRNAELQGPISRLNELQSVVRGLDMGSILAPGFDATTTAVGGLVGAMNQLIKYQEDYNKVMQEGTEEQKKNLQANDARARISHYAKLAGVTKDYFKQHTTAYKALSVMDKAFRAQELANTLGATAAKIASMWEVTKATISTENANTIATEQGFLARSATYVKEIFARFSAMLGPYGTAAAAAVVAAIGLTAFGGSSGSFTAPNEGTGTVLGDKEAKSASLANSIDRLGALSSMGLKYSSQMLVYLNAIEQNTRGVTTNIAKSKSYADFANKVGGVEGVKSTGLSRFISEGMGVGAIMGAFGISAKSLFGDAVNKLITSAFGKKVSIQGQGIFGGDQALGDILSGGFSGNYYADIKTKRKVAGVTTSTKYRTEYSAMDQTVEDEITKIFSNFAEVIRISAESLGIPMAEVDQKLKNFVVKIGKIDLKGLNAEDQLKKIEAVFSAEGDRLAESTLEQLKVFQLSGEGFLETVTRVAGGLEEANYYRSQLALGKISFADIKDTGATDLGAQGLKEGILDKESAKLKVKVPGFVNEFTVTALSSVGEIIKNFTGNAQELASLYSSLIDLRSGFDAIGLSASLLTEDLISASGGMDNLKQNWQSFQDNFLSNSEKIAIQTSILDREFGNLGMSIPASAEDFKKLVLQTKDMGVEGSELLAKLLGLSEGMAVLAEETKRVQDERISLEEKLLDLQGNSAELKRRELESLDPSNRALQEQIWLLEDQKKATEELNNALKQAGKTIADEIKRLLGVTTAGNPAALQTEFALKTAQARAGSVDALNALPELSKAIETLTLGKASTQLEVDTMRSWLAGSLAETMKQLGISVDEVGNVTTGNILTNPSTSTGGAFYVDNTNQALLSELKTLNAKVADLEAAAVATALSNSKMQKLLDRVAADGNNFSVVVNTEAAPVKVQTV